ncbi:hypothetical protein DY000_02022564 [Brassica cretica]|uniref:Uncharacterized protein n=1 Tax=Brassica cretica TaxID=69181 RepID=A0ABQ7E431_BRACR|nr:hypothetical protein DY000_02022564 [Brassica cretica]
MKGTSYGQAHTVNAAPYLATRHKGWSGNIKETRKLSAGAWKMENEARKESEAP